jgi:hypothetical protein
MTDYALVLSYCFPGKQWAMLDADYETLTWMDDSKKPTKSELDGLWEETQNKIKKEQDSILESRKSAEAKLAKLGLTVDEVKSILT